MENFILNLHTNQGLETEWCDWFAYRYTHAVNTRWTRNFNKAQDEAECFINSFEFFVWPTIACTCKLTKQEVKVTNFNMQSEFTALQGAIHDLTNLKQEFDKNYKKN